MPLLRRDERGEYAAGGVDGGGEVVQRDCAARGGLYGGFVGGEKRA